MNEVTRPVLRWFGGKFLLAPWIISQMPPHRIYVEPYGGAASVLMRKPRSYAEIYNDLDSGVVSTFRVLQYEPLAKDLKQLLKLTPFAREEFEEAHKEQFVSVDCVERARRMIIRSFMGFGSDSVSNPEKSTGFRANSNRSGTTPAHDWVNYADCIGTFTERLRGVVIENRDATDVMKAADTPETLHFVDPPYVHETKSTKHGYRFEMDDADHTKLCDFLKTLKGMVILCGYENKLYESLGWHSVKREAHANGARDRVEVLWLNPACEKAQSQQNLFRSHK